MNEKNISHSDAGLSKTNESAVRQYYAAWETKDWGPFDVLLADNFTFTSPNNDDHISKSAFKARCWESQVGFIEGFDLQQVIGRGNEAFVLGTPPDQERQDFPTFEQICVKRWQGGSHPALLRARSSFASAAGGALNAHGERDQGVSRGTAGLQLRLQGAKNGVRLASSASAVGDAVFVFGERERGRAGIDRARRRDRGRRHCEEARHRAPNAARERGDPAHRAREAAVGDAAKKTEAAERTGTTAGPGPSSTSSSIGRRPTKSSASPIRPPPFSPHISSVAIAPHCSR